MTILYSAADAVNSGNWPILFKILTLNVAMWTVFLRISNFGMDLSLNSVADFSNISARVPNSAEHTPCFPVQRVMRFESESW